MNDKDPIDIEAPGEPPSAEPPPTRAPPEAAAPPFPWDREPPPAARAGSLIGPAMPATPAGGAPASGRQADEKGASPDAPSQGPASVPETTAAAPARIRSAPRWLLAISLALILLLGAALGFVWWYSAPKAETQNRIAELGSHLDSLGKELGSNARSVSEQITRLQGTDETVQRLQEAHGISIEKLALLASQDTEDLIFAEINYLLGIAQQRLSFERDVPTAIHAMEAADQRLSNLIRPDLERVRAVFAGDINDLRAVPVVDLTGPALFLADVYKRIESLPFQGGFIRPPAEDKGQGGDAEQEPRPPVKSLDEMALRVWSDLRGLVSIKALGAEDARIFEPGFRQLIERQLALEISNARLELSRRDGAAFKATVGLLASLMGRYYDGEDPAVSSIRTRLGEMQSLELSPPIPDVANSIKALREYVLDRRKLGQGEAPSGARAAPDAAGAEAQDAPAAAGPAPVQEPGEGGTMPDPAAAAAPGENAAGTDAAAEPPSPAPPAPAPLGEPATDPAQPPDTAP